MVNLNNHMLVISFPSCLLVSGIYHSKNYVDFPEFFETLACVMFVFQRL